MNKLQNITSQPFQQHTLLLDDSEVVIELRYLPAVEIWTLSVKYEGRERNGLKLSANVYHLRQYGFPFDFTVLITDGSGIDPFRPDDFASGRCELYYITPDEMQVVRGQVQ